MELEISSANYYLYITTDKDKTVFSVSTTCDLKASLEYLQHNVKDHKNTCRYLVYWEEHDNAKDVIFREDKINGLSKKKKLLLINTINPGCTFLNNKWLNR